MALFDPAIFDPLIFDTAPQANEPGGVGITLIREQIDLDLVQVVPAFQQSMSLLVLHVRDDEELLAML